jgi:hypothetical protein
MKMLEQDKTDPGWTTPLIEFWDRTQYYPAWTFYFEAVVLVGLMVMMWRIRPMVTQRIRARREQLTKGIAPKRSQYEQYINKSKARTGK